MRANHPTLDDVRTMPIGEIAALPADQLALLQDDADAALESAKKIAAYVDGAIALRYGERAQALRRDEGKDTGTVRFDDGPVTVVADLPKRVEWDQEKLVAALNHIPESERDQYVRISYAIDERKYVAWPEALQAFFRDARTVKAGKPRFRLLARDVAPEVA